MSNIISEWPALAFPIADGRTGVGSRLRNHERTRKDWTHYSFYEVHDNVSREEIMELESLRLAIFRHDSIKVSSNLQETVSVFQPTGIPPESSFDQQCGSH